MIRETVPVGLLNANCTILGDETSREAIVVDPGGDVLKILALIAKHHLTVKLIVVTHVHLDHICGTYQLKTLTNAPVLYHHLDMPLVAVMHRQAWFFRVDCPKLEPPDQFLRDGDTFGVVGISGTTIHTSGHTWGSICLYFPVESLLLTGDTMFAGSLGRTDFPGGDTKRLLQSVSRKIMPLPDATLLVPGHGGTTTLGWEREHTAALAGL